MYPRQNVYNVLNSQLEQISAFKKIIYLFGNLKKSLITRGALGFGVRQTWALILAGPLTSQVTKHRHLASGLNGDDDIDTLGNF